MIYIYIKFFFYLKAVDMNPKTGFNLTWEIPKSLRTQTDIKLV